VLLTSGVLVFGDVDDGVNKNMKSATLVMKIINPPVSSERQQKLNTVMDKLVQEGKLTRAKADQIIKYAEEKWQSSNQGHVGYQKLHLVKSLRQDGIINDKEAEAIRSKFREVREQIMTDKLNGMVQKGTITRVQADKIKVYFENTRKENIEKIKNMTEEQRQTYFKEHKRGQSAIEKLVNDGVITKEQAKELKMVLWEGHKQ
jgi:polyhydroxyalkanoate synthesis regulator phasin